MIPSQPSATQHIPSDITDERSSTQFTFLPTLKPELADVRPESPEQIPVPLVGQFTVFLKPISDQTVRPVDKVPDISVVLPTPTPIEQPIRFEIRSSQVKDKVTVVSEIDQQIPEMPQPLVKQLSNLRISEMYEGEMSPTSSEEAVPIISLPDEETTAPQVPKERFIPIQLEGQPGKFVIPPQARFEPAVSIEEIETTYPDEIPAPIFTNKVDDDQVVLLSHSTAKLEQFPCIVQPLVGQEAKDFVSEYDISSVEVVPPDEAHRRTSIIFCTDSPVLVTEETSPIREVPTSKATIRVTPQLKRVSESSEHPESLKSPEDEATAIEVSLPTTERAEAITQIDNSPVQETTFEYLVPVEASLSEVEIPTETSQKEEATIALKKTSPSKSGLSKSSTEPKNEDKQLFDDQYRSEISHLIPTEIKGEEVPQLVEKVYLKKKTKAIESVELQVVSKKDVTVPGNEECAKVPIVKKVRKSEIKFHPAPAEQVTAKPEEEIQVLKIEDEFKSEISLRKEKPLEKMEVHFPTGVDQPKKDIELPVPSKKEESPKVQVVKKVRKSEIQFHPAPVKQVTPAAKPEDETVILKMEDKFRSDTYLRQELIQLPTGVEEIHSRKVLPTELETGTEPLTKVEIPFQPVEIPLESGIEEVLNNEERLKVPIIKKICKQEIQFHPASTELVEKDVPFETENAGKEIVEIRKTMKQKKTYCR